MLRSQKSQIARTPPAQVRRQLRAEVGFGCPICGSPHLEYHHFDPPFAEMPHHNPYGMIALCANHHAQADSLTKNQLRDLKSKRNDKISSNFLWRRKHTVFSCGGNIAYQCGSMLRVNGFNLVYFEKDENGYDTLSLNIYDMCLNNVFEMRKNDWISRADIDDIEAPPSANRLRMRSKLREVSVDLHFKDRPRLSPAELTTCERLEIPEKENVVFCYFNGEIAAPVPVKFVPSGVFIRGLSVTGNTMVRCGVGIQVG